MANNNILPKNIRGIVFKVFSKIDQIPSLFFQLSYVTNSGTKNNSTTQKLR